MGIYGQDWASYQSPNPDTTGLSFVFVKVTEGSGYTNPEWQQQRDHARAAGLVVGFYHYPHMDNDPTAEADRFLALVQPQPGDVLCLDWEGYDPANSGVPKAAQLAYKEAWLRHAKAAQPHVPVGMYANTDYWRNVDTTGYYQDFLWIAADGPAGQPNINANWLFHQYGEANGLDLDYCHLGSTDDLRAWTLSFQPPAPSPAPQPSPTGTPAIRQGDDDMATGQITPGFVFDASGAFVDAGAVTMIPLPTVGGTRWPYIMVDLSFASDFGDAKLRVAIHGKAGWRIQYVTVRAIDDRINVWLQPGDTKASVCRVPMTAAEQAAAGTKGWADEPDVPVAWFVEPLLKA